MDVKRTGCFRQVVHSFPPFYKKKKQLFLTLSPHIWRVEGKRKKKSFLRVRLVERERGRRTNWVARGQLGDLRETRLEELAHLADERDDVTSSVSASTSHRAFVHAPPGACFDALQLKVEDPSCVSNIGGGLIVTAARYHQNVRTNGRRTAFRIRSAPVDKDPDSRALEISAADPVNV